MANWAAAVSMAPMRRSNSASRGVEGVSGGPAYGPVCGGGVTAWVTGWAGGGSKRAKKSDGGDAKKGDAGAKSTAPSSAD